METLYTSLMRGEWSDETRDSVWRRWLWETDCNAPPLEQCCDMNLMHVLGVLCCLGEARNPVMPVFGEPIGASLLPHTPVVHLHPAVPIASLSLRQLLDQLECLQLHWGPVLSGILMSEAAAEAIDDDDACFRPSLSLTLLRCMMARLGEIAHNAYEDDDGVLDDPQHCTPMPSQLPKLLVISRKSLRQAVCVLFSLMRVREILARSDASHEPTPEEHAHVVGALRQHHVEVMPAQHLAAGDLFSEMQQMVHLAPGMRLVYRTNFAGMYNHVSQVVYFHYPRFSRKPHFELKKIPAAALHMLPLVTQLLPDIPVVYDDDSFVPGLMDGRLAGSKAVALANAPWAWLVCCGWFLHWFDLVHLV